MVTVGLLIALAILDGQKISIDLPAMPARKALAEVGVAAHLLLSTSPQTAEDTLLLRFNDIPVNEAMRRIALADDASWRKEKNGFRLTRTSEQQRAEDAKELKEKVDAFSAEIADKAAAVEKMPVWSAEQSDKLAAKVATLIKSFNPSDANNWNQATTRLSDQGPLGRAMTGLLANLDPRELAQLPAGLKTVWSTNPTAVQLLMPQKVAPILRQFLQNNTDWAASVDKYQLKAPAANNAAYLVGSFGDFSSARATPTNVSVVLLSAIAVGQDNALQFELTAYDNKGRKIAQAEEYLMGAGLQNGARAAKGAPDEPKISLSGDTKAIAQALRSRGRANRPMLPADVIARIADSEHHDPLDLLLGSCLKEAAKIRGVNLAAHLCDKMALASTANPNEPVSVDQFLQLIEALGGRAEIGDGWLMVQPRQPARARSVQADRKELGKYLSRCAESRRLSLEEQAAFAVTLTSSLENSLPRLLAAVVNPSAIAGSYNRDILKMYGLMTADQKARMRNEGFPCGSLTEQEKECLNRMIYGRLPNLRYEPPRKQGDEPIDWDLYSDGIYHEPTETLPNGIPPKGLIKLIEDNSTVVVSGDNGTSKGAMSGQVLTAQALAQQKYRQDHPESFPPSGPPLSTDKLLYGKRLRLTFDFQFTPELKLTETLEDMDTSAFQTATIGQLPDDFQKAFQAAYANFARGFANAKPGQLGGPSQNANIPPAR